MAYTAYKYRLYPNRTQEEAIARQFLACRTIWNKMLGDIKKTYGKTHRVPEISVTPYLEKYAGLQDADRRALELVREDLLGAYQRYLARGRDTGQAGPRRTRPNRSGAVPGEPKFKSKAAERKSYTTAPSPFGEIRVGERHITLPACGSISARIHRRAPEDWVLHSATVSCAPDGNYYCSVLYRHGSSAPVPLEQCTETLGIICPPRTDRSDRIFMDSDGGMAELPPGYVRTMTEVRELYRELSHKQGPHNGSGGPPSKNYREQMEKIRLARRRADRQLTDCLHNISGRLTDRYEVICAAEPDRARLAAGMDHGYTQLLSLIAYKQRQKGHYFIRIRVPKGSARPRPDSRDAAAKTTAQATEAGTAAAILEQGMRILRRTGQTAGGGNRPACR